ncbi:MAG: bifunctional aspartate kinase/homoserine dehydrogenase I [Bacteroidales bacterium]|nr:bifunctional aspartate kinase/homoserine dehydrogenase I [Bacteroidales bacterium]
MKILKFGGSSVATPESIRKVKEIVSSRQEPSIVVVSALGGVTDQLIRASRLAETGDTAFRDEIKQLRTRHREVCEGLLEDSARRTALEAELEGLLDQLERICEGIFLLHVLPPKTAHEVMGFGEQLSSRIIAAVLPGAVRYDATAFIKTRRHGHLDTVDQDLTYNLIQSTFRDWAATGATAVVPGFVASDAATGELTTLGRGGSDYTASLIAAALDAAQLEIWTDVDGFMTADPRIIKTSYVIEEMTYEEAMELCNFGAKVIYPPTLYPVCAKGIPILIKNTFNLKAPGTIVKKTVAPGATSIKGISSIDDISLITLSGTSMVGIVGVDSRIFSALAREQISAFLVSQSASETGISIGVSRADAARAQEVLSESFAREIESGAINPVEVRSELAAVAVIGENMKQHAGIAGKLFTTLGRNGISVIALAQGAAESNISFIVERRQLRKSLNVIHDNFFLSEYQELNLFVCGIGTVGGRLIAQIARQREQLMRSRGLKINIVGIARSTCAVFDRGGIDLSCWEEVLRRDAIPTDPQRLKEEIIGMNIFNSVFVDCTASADVAALYGDFFDHGISVVAANKIAASSDYANYRHLKDLARKRGVKWLFETNVGAGLPIIGTINDLCNSGDRILKMEAVLSGTLNFIFNTLSADIPFSKTVRMAQEQGFSEPDPRIDLSGKDVIRKLVILSREAGYEVNQEDVEANLFIPKEFFTCSEQEFWDRLPSLDADFEARRKQLEAEGKRWRFVAKMEEGKLSVSLRAVENQHSFYVLDGSNNIILLTTERYNRHPMLIQGYGAGADVTAAGVFADIMSIANI